MNFEGPLRSVGMFLRGGDMSVICSKKPKASRGTCRQYEIIPLRF